MRLPTKAQEVARIKREVWEGLTRRQKRTLWRAAGNRHRNYRPGTITKTGQGPSGPSELALERRANRVAAVYAEVGE